MKSIVAGCVTFIIATALQVSGQVVLNEHFTDGDFAFGSDAQDGNFLRQSGTTQTISIVTDNVIGGGNALAYSNPSNGTLFIGEIPASANLTAGKTLQFSFDFRFTTLPSSPNTSIFRFGIYDHAGGAPTDGGTETNPDSGYLDDFGAGGSTGDAGWGKESGGTDAILGGDGSAAIPNTGTQPSDINDTAAHHVLCRLTLDLSGTLTLATFLDGQQIDSATDASPFTSFNEVGFRLTGGAAVDYDNIVVIVPEPAPVWLVLAGAGLLALVRLRPRRVFALRPGER